jgi:hypothetical protein
MRRFDVTGNWAAGANGIATRSRLRRASPAASDRFATGLRGKALPVVILLVFLNSVPGLAAGATKPKSNTPPKQSTGSGLYTAGGRVYRIHGSGRGSGEEPALEAYRKSKALRSAATPKKGMPAPTKGKQPPKRPVPAAKKAAG